MNFEEDNFICLVWFNQDWENTFACAERRYDHILSVILLHFFGNENEQLDKLLVR